MEKSTQDRFILFALWLLVFASSSQIMIISPILPRIGEQLGINETLQGTLVTAYAVLVGIMALVTGPISDKIGRRKILLYGAGGMAVALACHGLAVNYLSLLLVRSLAGMAGGILSGAAVSYVGDYFPYERRGWANGWIMSGIAMGQIIGIPLGTVLANEFGFRSPFLIFSVGMIGAFFLILRFVPQPNVELDKNDLTVITAIKKYIQMVKQPIVAAASLSYLTMFLSVSVFIVFLPTWLEKTFSVSGNQIASLFLVGGIANVITGPVVGRLSDTVGRKRMIITSCLGFSAIIYSSTLLITTFTIAYPVFFLIMVLVAMRISPFQALLTALVDSKQRGALMSLMIGIGQVGFGLGGAIAGPIYLHGGFAMNSIIGGTTILIMAFLVWRFLPEPKVSA
ncbi:MFS transporter [bacterium]|nr:MAG: MFS transporter [bacterium]